MLYGIKRSEALKEQITLLEEYPSKIATMLVQGTIDVGLVPVAVIPLLKQWHIISDYCIGAEGPVASVCLFSDVPLEQVTEILLDYQSKTSVNLCRVLLKHYWKKKVTLKEAQPDYINNIQGTTAGVVIGDRALLQRKKNAYVYDLAECWQAFSGLPFVFAAWIANKALPAAFTEAFNSANATGLQHIEEVVAETSFNEYNLHTYYRQNISYQLTEEKKKGMQLFLQLLGQLNVAPFAAEV